MRLISLDLETAGLIPGKHHVLSIGAVDLETREDYYVQLLWNEILVCPSAMKVNKIDLCASDKDDPKWGRALPAIMAIKDFATWLNKIGCHNNETRALGNNVGIFDLPMLRGTWELLFPNELGTEMQFPFSYRSVDLNTLVMFACEQGVFGENILPKDIKKAIEEDGWDRFKKSELYREMSKVFSPGVDPDFMKHHALCDAWWNVHVWDYLKTVI